MNLHIIAEPGCLPTKGSNLAAGYDLVAHLPAPVQIQPGERFLIPTGVRIALPPGTYGRIAPRSGLAKKHGIDILAGVIDADYRGEVKVILINLGNVAYTVQPFYRIAQLLVEYVVDTVIVPVDTLPESERSDAGFGSSGIL